jgi:flagellar hook-associated protein 3 FlgL
MQTRADQAAVAQQARNIDDAKGWLDQTGSTLQSMLDVTRRIRELTQQGVTSGTASPSSKEALAVEVESLRQGLVSSANATIQGRPLFGGVTSGGKAYDANGAWVGNDAAEVTRRVSDDETMRIDVTGKEAFGTAPDDLFAVVNRIAAGLRSSDPTALDGQLDALDAATAKMSSALASIGSRGARIERLEQANGDRALTLTSRLSATEDIDLPETIMNLQMRQTGYEAALAATAKAIQPTLMDYLR